MQVFDNEIPVFFLTKSTPLHCIFISKSKRRRKRPTPVGGVHLATLCVLVILCERYGSLPLRHCWNDSFGCVLYPYLLYDTLNKSFAFVLSSLWNSYSKILSQKGTGRNISTCSFSPFLSGLILAIFSLPVCHLSVSFF